MQKRFAVAIVMTLCVGMAVEVAPRPQRTRVSGLVNVPASIDATGKTDVSFEMALFFALARDGATIVFPQGGRYWMDDTLVLDNRHHLTIDGNGATFFVKSAGDLHRSNILLEDSADITIEHLTVQGANPDGGAADDAYQPSKEHQHGFELLSDTYVDLDDVAATDTYGDFVYVGNLEDAPDSNAIEVENSSFARNGRQGISLAAAHNVLITQNTFSDMRMSTFDFEPVGPDQDVQHVTIQNNTIGAGRLLWVAAEGTGEASHVAITGNNLHTQALQAWVENDQPGLRDDWKVIGNTSDTTFGSPQAAAMLISHVNGLTISEQHAGVPARPEHGARRRHRFVQRFDQRQRHTRRGRPIEDFGDLLKDRRWRRDATRGDTAPSRDLPTRGRSISPAGRPRARVAT